MDTSNNTLAGAADGVATATETAGDIALVLSTWSKRLPLRINAHEQQEMRRLFRETHRLLNQAEQAVEQVVIAQIEQKLLDNGQPGTTSRYRAKKMRAGAL